MEIIVKGNAEVSEAEKTAYVKYLKEKNPTAVFKTVTIEIDDEGYANLSYELDASKFVRLRRITGYLVGSLERFNNGKFAEVNDRVKHNLVDTEIVDHTSVGDVAFLDKLNEVWKYIVSSLKNDICIEKIQTCKSSIMKGYLEQETKLITDEYELSKYIDLICNDEWRYKKLMEKSLNDGSMVSDNLTYEPFKQNELKDLTFVEDIVYEDQSV